ncbi:MAG TPA: thiamine-phosphate kinase [Steroidobacteraceae bacterium]|nr:thiamine-phosphate kinase [Steroidobacteraceae bacterium]
MAGDGHLGEFELIRRYFTRSDGRPAAGVTVAGIGDDAAVLRIPAGCDLVAAVDTIVEGRHFPRGSEPRSIGHRALAVNLSDIAAMGATPAWATLALTLPAADPDWLEGFSAGLFELARRHGVDLVGGDTTAGPLTVSVQVLGVVPSGEALRRGGTRAGDLIAVTGTLGDAGAGLEIALSPRRPEDRQALALAQRFLYPTPRVEFGRAARRIARAAMDVSDGMAGDLAKFAAAGGLAAHVDVERLPLSAALLGFAPLERALDHALAGGDDYELLVAVGPAEAARLAAAAEESATPLTVIGEFRAGRGVHWTRGGHPFTPARGGFDHFAGPSTQFTD